MAGQDCKVTKVSHTKVKCTTNPSSASSVNGTTVGQHGARRQTFSGWQDFANLDSLTVVNDTLMTSMDAPKNFDELYQYTQRIKAWFVAPDTAKYRFFISCDDHCELYLDQTSGSLNPTKIASGNSWTPFRWISRDYTSTDTRRSEWVSLEKGKHYYIEGRHREGGGTDHFSVSLEIDTTGTTTNASAHHHAMKEIQEIGLNTTLQFEKTSFTISNPDHSLYVIQVLKPGSSTYWISEKISDKATSAEVRNTLVDYYNTHFKTDIKVERQSLDANGQETADPTLMKAYKYTITLKKLISGKSVSEIKFTKLNSTSTASFTRELPDTLQLSKPPLSGWFRMKCVSDAGIVSYSIAINAAKHNWWDIRHAIQQGCAELFEKVDV